jgi:hypothetical protein
VYTVKDFQRRCIRGERKVGEYTIPPGTQPRIRNRVVAKAATIDVDERWNEAVKGTNDTGEYIFILEGTKAW